MSRLASPLALCAWVAGCALPAPSPRSVRVEPAPPFAAPPAASASAAAAASDRPVWVVAPNRPAEIDAVRTLLVTSIAEESIAAAPGYPAGSGVTVAVELGGEGAHLELLSEGYASARVAWLDGHRVELVAVEHGAARLAVERVTDRVRSSRVVRVRRGEKVPVADGVELELVRHRHKIVEAGRESPLIVDVRYHEPSGGEAEHHLEPPGHASFTHRALRFTLRAYEYDAWMELVVAELELEPVAP